MTEFKYIYSVFPSLVTIHNTYISVTPDYIHNTFFQSHSLIRSRLHSRSLPTIKTSISKRNSRIRQIGYSTSWKTFITLTFSNSYYSWSDYDLLQHYFRLLIKKLHNKTLQQPRLTDKLVDANWLFNHSDQTGQTVKPRSNLRYLAVLEHGKKSGRIHYHILTNIPYSSSCFRKHKSDKRKVLPAWTYGFSDVVKVSNKNCNAVHYLMKYVTKKAKRRTPVGKREVFSSAGLNKVKKILTYNPRRYLTGHELSGRFNRSLIYYKKNKKIGLSHFSKKNEKETNDQQTECRL